MKKAKARKRKPARMTAKQYKQTASEHSLQSNVLTYLNLHAQPNVHYFAIPNAGKRSFSVAKRMKAEGLRAGVSDLCIMLPGGRVLWLEMKTLKGKESEAQSAFGEICKALDHPYQVAHTFDEAITALRGWGAVKDVAA